MPTYETPKGTVIIMDEIENVKLPNPDLLSYYQDLEHRTFWIEGEINEAIMLFVKQIINFNREDIGIPIEKRKPIKIFINSIGGCIEETLAFVSVIKSSKTPIWTINACTAYSGAGIILMCGHKRFALPFTQCLIHSGSGRTSGTYEQTEQQMKQYRIMVNMMCDIIKNSTNIDQKLLAKKLSTDWYIGTEDALEYGIIDKIIDNLDEVL